MIKKYFKKMKGGGISPPRKPFKKIMWSWLGAFVGIYSISIINQAMQVDTLIQIFLVGSFGASAVLIYGAPQAEYAQPRNLIGGHIISAIIGVAIFQYLPFNVAILGSLAVSLSIVAMHLTRTLHPPGGATALIAIVGTEKIHNLGFLYVVFPILSGAIILLFVALIINNLSSNEQRHYPRYWL